MPLIEVSEETYDKLKKQFGGDIQEVEVNQLGDLVGQKWFFRTVTYHLLGKVKKIAGRFIVLENAVWVGDSGRFSDFLKTGPSQSAELEPCGTALLNSESIVDAFPWKHEIPSKVQ